jgi:hypothetical protein
MKELLNKDGHDCVGWAYLTVMIMRAIGIPATVDYVPAWGRKNGTHYTEVFWEDSLQSFRTPGGRELTAAAKVFRYTYKIQNPWQASIKPFIKDNIFVLDYLKNGHLTDVTNEHKKTSDVVYKLDRATDFAYICVFNYGNWHPVYWGEVCNKICTFKNMGTNVLYRIAVPDKKGYQLASHIFQIDSLGNQTGFTPDFAQKDNLTLSKLNTGAKSFVEKGKVYSLYYYDGLNNWILSATKTCTEDSILFFENLPTRTLYKINDDQASGRLERPFTYENSEQVFW